MPDITSDQLRDISIKTVEMFLNDRVPLSEGLAKQASLHDLNAEQIQRAVEATNSICYLKIIKVAEDRTVEFPLCKTAEVMFHITIPDSSVNHSISEDIEKIASVVEDIDMEIHMTPNEQFIMLTKMAAENKRSIEIKEGNLVIIEQCLYKKAAILSKDPLAQAKLSHLGFNDIGLEKSAGMVEQRVGLFIFKEADLKTAKDVIEFTKQASIMQSDITIRKELQKRAELSKKAFSLNPAHWAGRAIGAITSAPFKMVGRGLKNTIQGAANKVAPTMVSKPTGKGIGKALAVGGTAVSVGFDAAMYNPKPSSNIYYQMNKAGPY